MLKQRVITAVVMLAVLLPAIFYPAPHAFGAVALVLIAAGAWEWGKLNQCSQSTSLLLGAACGILCLLSWYLGLLYSPLATLWMLAGSIWVVVGAWLLNGGVKVWADVPQPVRLFGGVMALWIAWISVAQARIVGINFLFSCCTVLVWVADIAAYFAGVWWSASLIANWRLASAPENVGGSLRWIAGCGDLRICLACSRYFRITWAVQYLHAFG